MKKKQKRLSFEDWIDQIGPEFLAKKLGVDKATIRHWRAWRCDPRVDHIRKIKTLSDGRLAYEQIIDRGTPGKQGVRR